MTELTRQAILDGLIEEQLALMNLVTRLSNQEWHTLTRNDGWSVHDIVAHIADAHLFALAISGSTSHPSQALLETTLPIRANGEIDTDRLNILRYSVNQRFSRAEVMSRLTKAFALLRETVEALQDDQLTTPGPYGPPRTILEWFNDTVLHSREHRLQLEHICASK